MIYPRFLNKNDTIGVPAPSNGASDRLKTNKYENAKKRLENLGYNVVLSKNINGFYKGRSASAEERAQEFNDMICDNNINAIFCASGGEFLMEILPLIDYEKIKNNPKIISGFSDPTSLLYSITTKCDIATFYGQNFSSLGNGEVHQSEKDFLSLVEGKTFSFNSYDLYEEEPFKKVTGLEGYNLTCENKWKSLDNKNVSFEGRIIGGCFDVLSMIAGTKYDGFEDFDKKYGKEGIIWYFDNCELSMEETIRVLWKFNELDYFKNAKGIIFGRFGSDVTYFDYDTKTCLEDSILNKLKIPVLYDADFSHKAPCLPVVNGSFAKVEFKDNKGYISYLLN